MSVDLNDPKMEGFVPLNEEWAADCPDMASRRIRDESHFQDHVDTIEVIHIGTYQLWVDPDGKLRMKNGAPASSTDGVVVGTQT